MATTKQRDLISKLSREREVPTRWRGMIDAVVLLDRDLTAAEASGLISILAKAQRMRRF